MIDNSTLKVGGNKLLHWFGKRIQKWGNNMMEKGKSTLITNPSAKLANPFTLVISFTVDGIDKYQVITQGDYKKVYKESEDYIPDIPEKELFMIIEQKQKDWFKKE